jgi:hypothetical protein
MAVRARAGTETRPYETGSFLKAIIPGPRVSEPAGSRAFVI